MNINYKFFNFSSLKTELKDFKYSDTKSIKYNSFLNDETSLERVYLEINKVVNEYISKIKTDINENSFISQIKSLFTSNELLDTNESLERVFKILLSYGYKKKYARDSILDGYYDSELKRDILTSKKIVVCKIPLTKITNNSIRVFGFFKNRIFFPLFLDLNHCLMNNTSKEEQFFKKDKIIFINSLISNIK
ncbi:MAG: hypothetical protein KFW07_01190 [Mycoplasmataceae bacterium]|nr:hypothetical protein [Mycoplasmataceae bacterium]